MSPLPAKVKRGITPEQKKESEIKLGLPFKVPDFVCKFQMIFLITEQKPNAECTHKHV
jgi:hypothetical protein